MFFSFEAVKILLVSKLENLENSDKEFLKNIDIFGSVNFPANQNVLFVELNCAETHLIVLSCLKNSSFEYFMNVYDLQTLLFDSPSKTQVIQMLLIIVGKSLEIR